MLPFVHAMSRITLELADIAQRLWNDVPLLVTAGSMYIVRSHFNQRTRTTVHIGHRQDYSLPLVGRVGNLSHKLLL